jgi:hypothetical protein
VPTMDNTPEAPAPVKEKVPDGFKIIFVNKEGVPKNAALYVFETKETQFDWEFLKEVAADEEHNGRFIARIMIAARQQGIN